MKIVPLTLLVFTLAVCSLRWGKYLYFHWKGVETTAKISGKEKTRFMVDTGDDRAVPYYRLSFSYSDDQMAIHKVKMAKLYRENDYKTGDLVAIRYLRNAPDKAICVSWREFFTYEPICLLVSVIMFITLNYR